MLPNLGMDGNIQRLSSSSIATLELYGATGTCPWIVSDCKPGGTRIVSFGSVSGCIMKSGINLLGR